MHRIDKISNIPWTDEFVKNNINKIEFNWNLHPHKNSWQCNCHTGFDWEEDSSVLRIDFDFLRDEYTKIVTNYCTSQGKELSSIGDIWYNYYKFDQYQEPHNHISLDRTDFDYKSFVCVHYLIFDPKIHNPIMFEDKSLYVPEVSSGDALIFTSEKVHYVKESKTNSPRLSIAFGFHVY